MNLYVVDFEYRETHENVDEKDRWFFGCKDHIELEKTMELNIEKFKEFGYEVTRYGYQIVSLTDNGFGIRIVNPHEDLIPDRQGKELL